MLARRKRSASRPGRRLALACRDLIRRWAHQRTAAARLNLVDSLQSQVPDDRGPEAPTHEDPRHGV